MIDTIAQGWTFSVTNPRDGQVRLAEVVAALSLGIDLGFGQPMEHVLRQCLIALRLADSLGLDEQTRVAVYYTALLVNIGCHTDAHEQAKWFGDDIAMKADKYVYGVHGLRSAVSGIRMLGAGHPVLHRLRIGLEFAVSGQGTLANVLSGTAVAAALLVAFPARRRSGARLHPSVTGLARLAAYVATQLLVSNIVMTRQILRRRPETAPGVLAHRLQTPSEEVLTLMTSIIALSPGTMTADITRDSSVIYVHFFKLADRRAAHAALERLERLVVNAIAPTVPQPDRPVSKESP